MSAAGYLIPTLKTLATVALGTVGGLVAFSVNIPLPWMLGSILIVGIAGIAGVNIGGHTVHVPLWLRNTIIPILGVMLGSAFTPAIVAGMASWWITMLALVVYILLATAVAYQFYRRAAGFDPATAYFCSIPGGLVEMSIIGEGSGGDGRTISLVHFCRILFAVLTLPFLMRWLYHIDGGSAYQSISLGIEMELVDIALLATCAVAGYYLGKLARLPGAQISGPLLLSAIAHATGLTSASPPYLLIVAAQIIAGASLASRFAGVSVRAAGRILLASLCGTVLMLCVTLALAFALSTVVDEPFAALILAYAPGGVTEMSLIALSLNVGVAFVTAHHIARIALSLGMMPAIWRHVVSKRLA